MRGVSAPSIHDESSGVVLFLSRRSHEFVHIYTPKSTATLDPLNNLLVLAKSQHWPDIIFEFEGGPVMLLGLLQELHSCCVLARIPIFLPEETKHGHKP